MEASRAATGMLEVFATRVVRFITGSLCPSTSIISCYQYVHLTSTSGNSMSTSAISFPRSPQPT